MELYRLLLQCHGPQHWWPASGRFEVMVGAILTQAAAWSNVEKAIAALRRAGALSPAALRRLSLPEIARLVYPSGYYNAKARKLKALATYLGGYDDDLDRLFALPVERLRPELLGVYGIGEETADSILLYAGGKPVFVVDAYTRRILGRSRLGPPAGSYRQYQQLFMDNLPADAGLFNEYHALLVRHGKDICRVRPRCQECCLNENICHPGETGLEDRC